MVAEKLGALPSVSPGPPSGRPASRVVTKSRIQRASRSGSVRHGSMQDGKRREYIGLYLLTSPYPRNRRAMLEWLNSSICRISTATFVCEADWSPG